LYDGIDFDFYLTRQRFEGVCGKLYQQVFTPIDDLLTANGLQDTQIDQVFYLIKTIYLTLKYIF
jgi:molecular chaperone DnaK (HSP70)